MRTINESVREVDRYTDDNKIYVQIASYKDPQLIHTVKDLIEKACFPSRLHIVILDQNDKDNCEEFDQFQALAKITYMFMPAKDVPGLGFARAKLQEQYKGERFVLQLDSHHRFADLWDSSLIFTLTNIPNCKLPLLTSYANQYEVGKECWKETKISNVMIADHFTPDGTIMFRPKRFPEQFIGSARFGVVPARFVSGHFFFTFAKPYFEKFRYDPNIFFAGDEINLTVRLFTMGFDFFHITKPLVWHEYTRKGRKKIWEDHKFWKLNDLESKKRIQQLLGFEDHGIDLANYGLGTERTLKDYEHYAGVCFSERWIHKDASTFDNPAGCLYDGAGWTANKTYKLQINQCPDKVNYKADFWSVNVYNDMDHVLSNILIGCDEIKKCIHTLETHQVPHRLNYTYETTGIPVRYSITAIYIDPPSSVITFEDQINIEKEN